MNAIANSATAMNAVINSDTAMNAIANSATALNAVANSATAMNAILKSQTARVALSQSPHLMDMANTMYNTCNQNPSLFQKYSVQSDTLYGDRGNTPKYWTPETGATSSQPSASNTIVFVNRYYVSSTSCRPSLYHLDVPDTVVVTFTPGSAGYISVSPYQPLLGGIKFYESSSYDSYIYFYAFKAL